MEAEAFKRVEITISTIVWVLLILILFTFSTGCAGDNEKIKVTGIATDTVVAGWKIKATMGGQLSGYTYYSVDKPSWLGCGTCIQFKNIENGKSIYIADGYTIQEL